MALSTTVLAWVRAGSNPPVINARDVLAYRCIQVGGTGKWTEEQSVRVYDSLDERSFLHLSIHELEECLSVVGRH